MIPTELWVVVVSLVLGFGAVFCATAFKGLQRLQYRCRRCDHAFRRAPYRRFPAACPRCGAHEWALPPD